jgi:hypothetical protein
VHGELNGASDCLRVLLEASLALKLVAVVHQLMAGLDLLAVGVGKILNHLEAHLFVLNFSILTSTNRFLALLHLVYVVN